MDYSIAVVIGVVLVVDVVVVLALGESLVDTLWVGERPAVKESQLYDNCFLRMDLSSFQLVNFYSTFFFFLWVSLLLEFLQEEHSVVHFLVDLPFLSLATAIRQQLIFMCCTT